MRRIVLRAALAAFLTAGCDADVFVYSDSGFFGGGTGVPPANGMLGELTAALAPKTVAGREVTGGATFGASLLPVVLSTNPTAANTDTWFVRLGGDDLLYLLIAGLSCLQDPPQNTPGLPACPTPLDPNYWITFVDAIGDHLRSIADQLRARGITVVLGTYPATILPDITPCIDDPSLPLPQGLSQEQADFVNLFLSETNVRIRAVVAATPGTELVEVGNLAFPPNEFADCLHKNNLGDQREVPFWVAHAP